MWTRIKRIFENRSAIFLRGHQNGARAVEKMVMERAVECGYDTKKIWKDLLQ